jgi:isocitrate dehydrogenase kinase/phosphatase
MSAAPDIARTILEGFDKHYRLFRESGARAKHRFVRGQWEGMREASVLRIQMYDSRVVEAVDALRARFSDALQDEQLWLDVKLQYIGLLHEHRQPECAETFYNSVACRVLARRYYRNEYIFRRAAVSTEHLDGDEPTYRCHYPARRGLRATIRDVLGSFGLASPFEDLDRDVRRIVRALRERFPGPLRIHDNFQVQVLSSLFFRNKMAYVVGKAVNGTDELPFLAPLRRNDDGTLYVDTLLMKPEHIGRVFSLARSYFMVDMEVPSAYVAFLQTILPSKPKAELYTMLGLQKQGKTLFYRDLMEHMRHSSDRFGPPAGTPGMVMAVFTMPSFAYVFKVIRDWYEFPKDTDRETVKSKYLYVKYHDRAGRLADTLEYTNVALPLARFEPGVVAELQRVAPSQIEIDGEQLVLRHVYIERRMTPLDVYIKTAGEPRLRAVMDEFGTAIEELAAANIFAGDLLPKNFGVTRYGRVVFYDYDEIVPLTECVFRRLPAVLGVGPHDIFPEELPQFLLPRGRARELLVEQHPELTDPAFWISVQKGIDAGVAPDVFPYPKELRFSAREGRSRARPAPPAARSPRGTPGPA